MTTWWRDLIRLMLVGHNTVPLSLIRSTVTASVRRPKGGPEPAPPTPLNPPLKTRSRTIDPNCRNSAQNLFLSAEISSSIIAENFVRNHDAVLKIPRFLRSPQHHSNNASVIMCLPVPVPAKRTQIFILSYMNEYLNPCYIWQKPEPEDTIISDALRELW